MSKAAQYLLDECRMVLPGIQALFGFQLVAVFNSTFAEKLSPGEQKLHLVAIALLAVSIAIIMTPAAYHRQRGPGAVTETFVHLSTRLLLWSMLPLGVSICLDFYLIGRVIVGSPVVAVPATLLLGVFLVLWFVLPRTRTLVRLVAGVHDGPRGTVLAPRSGKGVGNA